MTSMKEKFEANGGLRVGLTRHGPDHWLLMVDLVCPGFPTQTLLSKSFTSKEDAEAYVKSDIEPRLRTMHDVISGLDVPDAFVFQDVTNKVEAYDLVFEVVENQEGRDTS